MRVEFEAFNRMSLGDNIWMIVITGGPCAGKSTGMARLHSMLSDRGYKVLVVPESATKLIGGGILPSETGIDVMGFQQGVLLDTLCQEQCFISAALAYRKAGYKVIILTDRGVMDGRAYMKPEEFDALLELNGTTQAEMCEQRYHAVMHLRTAADGAEQYYQTDNNTARRESAAVARELDQKTLEAWLRHPHPRVIDNSTDFEGKMDRLFAEICGVIGDPVPVEKEDKFLVKEVPKNIPLLFNVSVIIQDYLVSPASNEEHRVRARCGGDGWTYYYTIKSKTKIPGERCEREKIISEQEYKALLALRDRGMQTIKKSRSTFFWKNQYFELDVFSGSLDGLVLLEAERTDRSGELELPDFLEVVRNVTGETEYSNKTLARGGSIPTYSS